MSAQLIAFRSHRTKAPDPLVELLQRTAGGDEEALAELYRHMGRKIFAFAQRHVEDRDLAEGVVCDTMFEVWQNAKSFAGDSTVSTWILGIARHKSLDEVRRRAKFSPYDEIAHAETADDCASAFDGIVAQQNSMQVMACIKRLPAEQQECVHLVFYQDLSLAEVADIQGVPENTVKTRLFHARRKLRGLLS